MRKLYKLLLFTFLIILFTECKDEKAIKNIDKTTKNENEISDKDLKEVYNIYGQLIRQIRKDLGVR